MTQSVYAALNGKEIREIMKRRVCEEIDKIPGLKMALCFHQAEISVAFELKAYPKDCPVPEGEFSFIVNPSALTEDDFNVEEHIENVEEFREKFELLLKEHDRLTQLLHTSKEIYQTLVIDEERIIQEADNGVPDQVRMKNDLPIPVMQTVGSDGQKAEVFVKPNANAAFKPL